MFNNDYILKDGETTQNANLYMPQGDYFIKGEKMIEEDLKQRRNDILIEYHKGICKDFFKTKDYRNDQFFHFNRNLTDGEILERSKETINRNKKRFNSLIENLDNFRTLFISELKKRLPDQIITEEIIQKSIIKQIPLNIPIYTGESEIGIQDYLYTSKMIIKHTKKISEKIIFDILRIIKERYNFSDIEIYNICQIQKIIISSTDLADLIIYNQIEIPLHDVNQVIPQYYNLINLYFNYEYIESLYYFYFDRNTNIPYDRKTYMLIRFCKNFNLLLDNLKVEKTKKDEASFRLANIEKENINEINFNECEKNYIKIIHKLSQCSHKYNIHGNAIWKQCNNYGNANGYTATSFYKVEHINDKNDILFTEFILSKEFPIIFNLCIKILKLYTENDEKISLDYIVL